MITKNRFHNRLIKLARKIGQPHLNEIYFKKAKRYSFDKSVSNIECFSWALKELPKMFAHWGYNNGRPCLVLEERLSTLAATAVFFKLNSDELFHLFVPGYQSSAFWGRELNRHSTPADLVHNIYQFILYKENEGNSSLLKGINEMQKRKIIKKYKSLKTEIDETTDRMSKLCA